MYEYEFEDTDYDTGYGDKNGTLIVHCSPIYEDTSFDHAHGTHNQSHIVDVDVEYAEIFLVGNNGVDDGNYTFSKEELFKEFKTLKEELIEKLRSEES